MKLTFNFDQEGLPTYNSKELQIKPGKKINGSFFFREWMIDEVKEQFNNDFRQESNDGTRFQTNKSSINFSFYK